MPYFVYAIHTDSTINRLYDSFEDFQSATQLEQEMQQGRYPRDNYVVCMFFAEDDGGAKAKIRQIRHENEWPSAPGT